VTDDKRLVHTVVKVGGGLLSKSGDLDRVTQALTRLGPGRRVLIVPGGGPFADAVRAMCRRVRIGDDAAHWMAVLGMDQYGHALAARMPDAALVEREADIAAVLAAGRLPVLVPYRWLKAADPLAHSWDVTSDSIAAWFAGALRARRIVLIKPAPAPARAPTKLVDPYFQRTLPPGVEHLIVTSDDLGQLGVALNEGGGEGRLHRAGKR
jgi:5-(aminomethyl)-3-furanmethanol phosphate kinase